MKNMQDLFVRISMVVHLSTVAVLCYRPYFHAAIGHRTFSGRPSHAAVGMLASTDNLIGQRAEPDVPDCRTSQIYFERLYACSVGKPPLVYLPGVVAGSVMVNGSFAPDKSPLALREVSEHFDSWKMSVGPNDRSNFITLAQYVIHRMQEFDQPVVLVGSSFGGLLACYISAVVDGGSKKYGKRMLSRLVLVNPATSFDRSIWNTLSPISTAASGAVADIFRSTRDSRDSALKPLLDGASSGVNNVIDTLRGTADQLASPAVEGVTGRLGEGAIAELRDMFQYVNRSTLPAATMQWRLREWLNTGCFLMNSDASKFSDITTPTMILTGALDEVLPSESEGRRLKSALTSAANVELFTFPNKGHNFMYESGFDLHKLLRKSRTFQGTAISVSGPTIPYQRRGEPHEEELGATEATSTSSGSNSRQDQEQRDGGESKDAGNSGPVAGQTPAVDLLPSSWGVPAIPAVPTDREIAEARSTMQPFVHLFSPVFMSVCPVADAVDADAAVAATGSHVSSAMWTTRRVVKAGIDQLPTGHVGRPVLYVGNHQILGFDTGFVIKEFLTEKRVFLRGLNHPAIFENPVRPLGETLRNVFFDYGAVDVSPTAIFELMRLNSTILLYPGGADEAFHRKNESYQLFWPKKMDFVRMAAVMDAIIVPFSAIGMAESGNIVLDGDEILKLPLIGERAREFNARMPQARAGGNQSFIAPLVAPMLPSRNYFLFQEPVDTRSFSASNKTACREAYTSIRDSVEEGIQWLMRFRTDDQFRDFAPRIAYERVLGRQAPTAKLPVPYLD